MRSVCRSKNNKAGLLSWIQFLISFAVFTCGLRNHVSEHACVYADLIVCIFTRVNRASVHWKGSLTCMSKKVQTHMHAHPNSTSMVVNKRRHLELMMLHKSQRTCIHSRTEAEDRYTTPGTISHPTASWISQSHQQSLTFSSFHVRHNKRLTAQTHQTIHPR